MSIKLYIQYCYNEGLLLTEKNIKKLYDLDDYENVEEFMESVEELYFTCELEESYMYRLCIGVVDKCGEFHIDIIHETANGNDICNNFENINISKYCDDFIIVVKFTLHLNKILDYKFKKLKSI